MDGIVYLHNQAGIALSQANAEIQRLREENEKLRAELVERPREGRGGPGSP